MAASIGFKLRKLYFAGFRLRRAVLAQRRIDPERFRGRRQNKRGFAERLGVEPGLRLCRAYGSERGLDPPCLVISCNAAAGLNLER
jgi:hypothetical protein